MIGVERVSTELARTGYARLDAAFFTGEGPDGDAARRKFAESCCDLPPDEHGLGANRYRRHGLFIVFPWNGTMVPIPSHWDEAGRRFVSHYLQSAGANPEHQGKVRSFAPLTEEQRNSSFLQKVIWSCLHVTPLRNVPQPVAVGCHIVRLVAKPGSPAMASPNCIHQDHEPFTFAALIERRGVIGGENLIAAPEAANQHPDEVERSAIIARFTLEHPWDGWVVDDKKVSHYLSPVEIAAGYDEGHRLILLVDFTPMIPATQA
ncbi:2OG-Fe dioxygenase family protein [Bradyrhizobium sp. USDA 336]|uniref:2OG-Fe dioxygenase family protein n=1 Tax=Bradyrhizobium sp. USDA 336 TaxID=3156311 RepID=UPI003834AF77